MTLVQWKKTQHARGSFLYYLGKNQCTLSLRARAHFSTLSQYRATRGFFGLQLGALGKNDLKTLSLRNSTVWHLIL